MTCVLSVLVAAHDEQAYIAEALSSVFAQNLSDIEIVIVDDGSNDDTAAIVEALGRAAPSGVDVRLLRHERSRGLACARNTALAAARCENVVFLDADDAFEPGALAALTARLQRDEATRLVFPRYLWVRGDGSALGFSFPVPPRSLDVRALLLDNPVHSDSGVMTRREHLRAIGGFDAALSGYVGADAWIRFAVRHGDGAIAATGDATVRYRRHDAQITADWQRMDRNWRIMMTKLEREWSEIVAPIRAQATARHLLFCSHLAYKAGDYRAARTLLSRAIRAEPAMLRSRSDARARALACAVSILPARMHRYLQGRFIRA